MSENITIDGKQYELGALPEAVRHQVANLQATDGEIARLQMQLAIAQTARNAYVRALQDEMSKSFPAQVQ